MPKIHSYGWKKDKPDNRDYIYHGEGNIEVPLQKGFWSSLLGFFSSCKKQPAPVPPPTPPTGNVDLRYKCPPVVDQGQLGSCTANALAGALAFLEIKDTIPDQAFSRLYIYYNERVIEGTVGSDAGAEIRDGMKTLETVDGACYETTWPYDINQFTVKPPANAYTEGGAHLVTLYASIQSFTDMQTCLDAGFPFVYGFNVYESFESAEVAATGVVPMPASNEQLLGGHAVLCVGYDNPSQRFICRNSWGTDWGQAGYFTIPYAYLTNTSLCSDFWTIRAGEDMLRKP